MPFHIVAQKFKQVNERMVNRAFFSVSFPSCKAPRLRFTTHQHNTKQIIKDPYIRGELVLICMRPTDSISNAEICTCWGTEKRTRMIYTYRVAVPCLVSHNVSYLFIYCTCNADGGVGNKNTDKYCKLSSFSFCGVNS